MALDPPAWRAVVREDKQPTHEPPDQVDRATLAEVGVGHLRLDHPGGSAEGRRDQIGELGMPLVEQPIESATAPTGVHREERIHGCEDPLERAHRCSAAVPTLHQRNQSLADARCPCQVHLTPGPSPTERPHDAPDPLDVGAAHGRSKLRCGSALDVTN